MPYILSKLGSEKYGIWSIVNSFIGIMGVFNFGIGDASIKYVSDYHSKNDKENLQSVIENAVFIYIIICVLIFLTGFFAFPVIIGIFKIPAQYKNITILIIRISTISCIFNILTTNLFAFLKGIQIFKESGKIILLRESIRTSCIITLLHFGFGLIGMAIANLTGLFVGLLCVLFAIKKFLPESILLPKFKRTTFNRIFGFSIYSFINTILTAIKSNIGNVFISRYLGVSFVPYFSIPYSIYSQLISISGTITAVLFPLFSSLKALDKKSQTMKIYFCSNKVISFIAGLTATIGWLFSDKLLMIWLGSDFSNNSAIGLIILFLMAAIIMTNTVSYNYILGSGDIRFLTYIHGFICLCIFISAFFMIPRWGLLGSVLSYCPDIIALNYIPVAIVLIKFKNSLKVLANLYMPILGSLISVIFVFSLFCIKNDIIDIVVFMLACLISYLSLYVLLDIKFLYRHKKIILPSMGKL